MTQLKKLLCDLCGNEFEFTIGDKPAQFGMVKGYSEKMEKQADGELKPQLKEFSADCCPDCWKKVLDYALTLEKK